MTPLPPHPSLLRERGSAGANRDTPSVLDLSKETPDDLPNCSRESLSSLLGVLKLYQISPALLFLLLPVSPIARGMIDLAAGRKVKEEEKTNCYFGSSRRGRWFACCLVLVAKQSGTKRRRRRSELSGSFVPDSKRERERLCVLVGLVTSPLLLPSLPFSRQV